MLYMGNHLRSEGLLELSFTIQIGQSLPSHAEAIDPKSP